MISYLGHRQLHMKKDKMLSCMADVLVCALHVFLAKDLLTISADPVSANIKNEQ